jgi:hypothetical protein
MCRAPDSRRIEIGCLRRFSSAMSRIARILGGVRLGFVIWPCRPDQNGAAARFFLGIVQYCAEVLCWHRRRSRLLAHQQRAREFCPSHDRLRRYAHADARI